jgi:hypothetical protein
MQALPQQLFLLRLLFYAAMKVVKVMLKDMQLRPHPLCKLCQTNRIPSLRAGSSAAECQMQ